MTDKRYPYADGERNDSVTEGQIRYTLETLCLKGEDLEAAFNVVLGIMKNGSGKAFNKLSVLCGAYPEGCVIDGVRYTTSRVTVVDKVQS